MTVLGLASSTMTEKGKSAMQSLLHLALGGGSIGAGAVLAFAVSDVIKSNPTLFLQTIANWGPIAFVVMLALYFIHDAFGKLINLGRDNVKAQQQMAEAMRQIADKDDRQAEETQTLVAYSAQQSERAHENQRQLETKFDELKKVVIESNYWMAQYAEKTRRSEQMTKGDAANAATA